MYQPLKVGRTSNPRGNTTVMAPTGENDRDLAQLLDVKYAQNIINYIIYGQGRLEKRKGLTTLLDASSTSPITFIEWLTSDLIIFGYGTTIAYYSISADAITNLKTDFSSNNGFDGARYGSYMFIVNGVDSTQRIQQELSYTGQSQTRMLITHATDPVVGETLTGANSGATGVVSTFDATTGIVTFSSTSATDFDEGEPYTGSIAAAGAITVIGIQAGEKITGGTSGANAIVASKSGHPSGTLVLKDINGSFQNGETITSEEGETATTSSVITLSIQSQSGAPIGEVCRAIGPRLFIGAIKGDESAVQYSAVDTGDDPPFTNWTDGTDLDSADTVRYKAAGKVNSVVPLGDAIVVFHEDGFHAFRIAGLDSAGTLSKLNSTLDRRLDYGGAKNAINTKEGVFFANEGGMFQLVTVGSTEIPYTEQIQEPTQVLAPEEFKSANFDNVDFVYDPLTRYVYMTYATDGSVTNNAVIAYCLIPEFAGISRFSGWSINRFMKLNNVIYGGSSVNAKAWQLFEGTDDDGFDIATEYTQELNIGSMSTVKDMKQVFCGAEMAANTSLNIRFDIYDEFGRFVKDKLILTWTPTYPNNTEDGWGLSPWGSSAWGASTSEVDLAADFSGRSARIKNLTRLRIRITGSDQLPHRLNWLSVEANEKRPARRRNLTKV